MSRRVLLTAALAALLTIAGGGANGLAHPGHGSMALVGTLATVAADHLTLDVRDVATGRVERLRVKVDADTKLRLGKETLASLTPWIGAHVVAAVDYEEDVDGRTIYTATKVQVTPPKKPRG